MPLVTKPHAAAGVVCVERLGEAGDGAPAGEVVGGEQACVLGPQEAGQVAGRPAAGQVVGCRCWALRERGERGPGSRRYVTGGCQGLGTRGPNRATSGRKARTVGSPLQLH